MVCLAIHGDHHRNSMALSPHAFLVSIHACNDILSNGNIKLIQCEIIEFKQDHARESSNRMPGRRLKQK